MLVSRKVRRGTHSLRGLLTTRLNVRNVGSMSTANVILSPICLFSPGKGNSTSGRRVSE